jgi:hypothetical protein
MKPKFDGEKVLKIGVTVGLAVLTAAQYVLTSKKEKMDLEVLKNEVKDEIIKDLTSK